MPTQSIDSQISHYLPLLAHDQKKSILMVIKSFMKHQEEYTQRISIEQYNNEIDEAMERVNKGEFYTHEEVEEMAKSW